MFTSERKLLTHGQSMKNGFLAMSLMAISVAASAGVTQFEQTNADTRGTLEQWRKDYRLPSLSMAVSVDGQVVFAEAVGYADVEKNLEATIETQYSIGSMAKPLTAVGLMELVSQGKLDLDGKVNVYLAFEPSKSSAITLRQLASHTAGIGRPWSKRNELEFTHPKDHASPMEVLPLFSSDPLEFKPGEDFQYTSMGYVLLSAVMEKAAGKSFTQYMHENIWRPLGMDGTAIDNSKVKGPREARYYKEVAEDGSYVAGEQKRDRSYLFGGGGFVSTPTDLVKMASLWSGQGMLDKELLDEMITPINLKSGEANEQNYALGWRVASMEINGEEVKAIHHGGVTWQAATGFMFIIPKYQAAIAYVTNMSPDKFGEVRGKSAEILKGYIEQSLNVTQTKTKRAE